MLILLDLLGGSTPLGFITDPIYDQYVPAYSAFFAGMNLLVPDISIGDTSELPPTLNTVSDKILMSYSGYRIPVASMFDPVDRSGLPIIVVTAINMDWTVDPNQILWLDWVIDRTVSDENVEQIILPFLPAVFDEDRNYPNDYNNANLGSNQAQDTTNFIILPFNDWTLDTDNQKDFTYNVPFTMLQITELSLGDFAELPPIIPSIIQLTDAENQLFWLDYTVDRDVSDISVELITRPNNIWDHDSDNQLMNLDYTVDKALSEESVEQLTIPMITTIAYDNDSDNQIPNPVYYKDQDDFQDNTKLITLPSLSELLDDERHQMSIDVVLSNLGSDSGQDTTNFIILPPLSELLDEERNQLANEYNFASIASDAGEFTNNVIIPTQTQSLDEERNQLWFDIKISNLASDIGDWTNLIVYANGVIKGWDTDSENQISNNVQFSSDTLSDEIIENISAPPAPIIGIDTDAENQLPNPLWTFDRDLMDVGVEVITLPPLAEVLDEDRQQFSNERHVGNLASDPGQDTTNFIIQPPADWTLDTEQQLLQKPFDIDRESSDNNVENIVLPFNVWDNDGENQLSNPTYSIDKELSEANVENIIIPLFNYLTDADQQKLQAEYYKDHLSDEEVELITIPPTVPSLYAWDTDSEQQFSNEFKYSYCEDPTDRGVRIFIPIQDTTPVEDNQISNQVQFNRDTLSDEGVENIIIPSSVPTVAWDTDSENQIPSNTNFTVFMSDDQDSKEGTKQIILPPYINIIDGDAGGDDDVE